MNDNRQIRDVSDRFSSLKIKTRRSVVGVLDKYAFDIYRGILKMSPVGEKYGGTFRAQWKIADVNAPGIVWAKQISNNMPYAGPLVYGSPVGGLPWPSAGPRTVQTGDRIFSSQAPEGVLKPVLENQATKAISKQLLEVITELIRG